MSQCCVKHQHISGTKTHIIQGGYDTSGKYYISCGHYLLVLSTHKPTFDTKLFVNKVKIRVM